MRKASLILVFASGALASLTPVFYNAGLPEAILYPDRLLCIPALLYGVASWFRVRSFARSMPVLGCIVLSLIGVLIVDETERGRAMLVFAGIAAAVPIAALIVDLQATALCTKVFIAASVLNMLILMVATGGLVGDGRFGDLIIDDMKVSNPNGFAAQMGFAAVLTTSLLRQKRRTDLRHTRGNLSLSNRDTQLMLLLAFLALGILMSASRGAIITLFGIIVMLIFSGTTKVMHRIAFIIALGLVTFVILGTENEVISRFRNTEEVVAFGDRLPIWEEAIEVLRSEEEVLWFGVGTGGAEKALAESNVFDSSTYRGEDGISRKATHNSYVEWCLTHGLLDVSLAIWLTYTAVASSLRLDRRDKSADRKMLLAYCAIISMVTALYRASFVTPLCALALAMLSAPHLVQLPRSVNRHTKRSSGAKTAEDLSRLGQSLERRPNLERIAA